MPNFVGADIDRRVTIFGRDDDHSIQRVSDLRSLPFVVLLGEPGIGKSTVLSREAAKEGTEIISARALMTGSQAPPNNTLFVDALDEYRTEGGSEDKIHLLANALAKSNHAQWRLTCRSEDWRKAADLGPMQNAVNGKPIVVAQLLPLDTEEALAVLAYFGELDPKRFVSNAKAYGATAFLESPLALKLLRSAVADGGAWPANRYELFASATRKLSFERNEARTAIERESPDDILRAAAETFLLLLLSGARALWRSNREPPTSGDQRAFLTSNDVRIDRNLFNDMLDTPLFRGEGETFEPLHKTVAEFLAAQALSTLVTTSPLSLDRALALTTGNDARAPTELRGLFAWFAAHLTVAGDRGSALRLIKIDPVSVLSYGDAAVFDTPLRREILSNLDETDPYFRASEVGVTAVGGLAGEDLAKDFAEIILASEGHGTHRLITVFEALTLGRPVLSLRPLLRTIVLDPARSEWTRRRAVESYLNGSDTPTLRRELFDALSVEPASVSREAIRAHLAAGFAPGTLTVVDLRSVLADYQSSKPDNVMGRLFALMNRLETEPLPELFDVPTKSWLPPKAKDGADHAYEVNHLLDRALASAIRATAELTASRLWLWLENVRRDPWSELKDATRAAVTDWLKGSPEREVAIFNEILARADMADGPWIVVNKYIKATQRMPSASIVRWLLTNASTASVSERKRLLTIAVEISAIGKDEAAYWETYCQVELSGDNQLLLERLTTSRIEDWRRDDAKRRAKASESKRRQTIKNVKILEPLISELALGRHPHHLEWAALLFFERDGVPSVQRIVDSTNEKIAEAIVAGWRYLATNGLGEIDAAKLGTAEGENRRYYVETAAVAGIYRMLSLGELPAGNPLEIALAVLKSSWITSGEDRRKLVDDWALDRLTDDPSKGADQLIAFWNGALTAGAEELPFLWHLAASTGGLNVVKQPLAKLLLDRPALPPKALRSAARVSAKVLDKAALIDASRLARQNEKVSGIVRDLWTLIGQVLDPDNEADFDQSKMVQLFLDDANSDLIGALCGVAHVDHLPTRVFTVQALGPCASPVDRWSGRVHDVQRLSERVSYTIDALSSDGRPEAAKAFAALAADPELAEWHDTIRHAQAQQRRLMRDQTFRHPAAAAARAALYCGPPVNASDLRAVVTAELRKLSAELRSDDARPWRQYWNRDNPHGKITSPLIENDCRDHLLLRLRDRLDKYRISAALPEARRGEETRADVLILSGAGRNLPIEAKRHFHRDLWIAASTQLQGYAAAPGADGLGIYLVFWFGNDIGPTPTRPDGRPAPSSAVDLEAMLNDDLPSELKDRIDVLVFDVSKPAATKALATRRTKPVKPTRPASGRRNRA